MKKNLIFYILMVKIVILWTIKTFEQVEIQKSITGEKYKLLKENLEVTISFMDEKPISVELPNNIECTH